MKRIISYKLFESAEDNDKYILNLSSANSVLGVEEWTSKSTRITDSIKSIAEKAWSDVKYYKDGINPSTCIRVSIKDGKDRLFRLDDIMDVLLRLKDYLKETKYSIEISFANSDVDLIKPMDEFIEKFKGEELYHIYLFIS